FTPSPSESWRGTGETSQWLNSQLARSLVNIGESWQALSPSEKILSPSDAQDPLLATSCRMVLCLAV
ncbi:hypothetical protein A2U01_0074934, partial [Trifolium medium]|nr:hypothetical protein [Trifolium medium]